MTIKEVNVPDARPLIMRLCEYKNTKNVKNAFMPPKTLGMPTEKSSHYKDCMTMDRCIRNVLSGFKNDIAFTAAPMFVGYAMLSNVSQEALIRAGVETVADEATRKLVQWTYDEDDGSEDTDKEKILAELETQATKYKLKERFREAACKDGYFGGCLVYIDVGDLDDVEAEEPLVLDKKTFKKGSLRGFKVIEPINVYPGEYNTSDPTDEHYFNPEFWYVLGKKYHASRFLYMAGNDTPVLLKPAYNFFGIPQAQLALDYVAHFVANRESAQELLNKFSLTCWKTDMTQALQGGSCNDLVSRVKLFNKLKTNNGTMVLNKDTEDMMQINTPLSGVRDIVEMSLNLLTAVWRIPKIKYLGEGEGGLNASSKEQMRSYYDYIMSYKEKVFTQPMETVLKLFQLNLGWDINEAIGFKFPVMWDMDDSERAQLNKQQADRDALYLSNGVLSQEEVRRRLSLDKNSDYTMIDVDDVPEPQEQPLPEVDKEEQNEADKKAMDSKLAMDEKKGWHSRFKSGLAMDDRWITIGHRDAEGDDEGRKGRHILSKEGETPKEAIERTTGTDIDKDGKVGKKDDKPEEKPSEKEEKKPETKPEPKPESKTEEKKEEPKEEKKEPVSEKTPAVEYAELLDKEKAGELSDAEKARKKELEDKEGFGEKEKRLEDMTDEELATKEKESDKEYEDMMERRKETLKKAKEEDKELNDLQKEYDALYEKALKTDHYTDEGHELSQKMDEVNSKINKRRDEIFDEVNKKFDKEYKEITAKAIPINKEINRRKSEKAAVSEKKKSDFMEKFSGIMTKSDEMSDEDFINSVQSLEEEVRNSDMTNSDKQEALEQIQIRGGKVMFSKKANTVAKKVKEYSKTTDALVKEFESFDDPYEKWSKEREEARTKLEEMRKERDNEKDPEKKKKLETAITMQILQSHFSVASDDLNKIKYERTMAVANILRKQKNTGTQVVAGKSTIKGIYDKLNGVLGGVIGKNVRTDDAPRVQAMRGRAYYSSSDNMFKVEKDGDFGDVIHEYTHFLERNNSKMLANSLAFAEYRTKGEDYQRLSTLTGNRGYKGTEIAKKDRFFSPYCGKIYSQDQEYRTGRASEIMSMGVERLFREPAKFAKEDREYFDFVVANLRGEL